MSEYLNNYVIDPLARQARRLSQISTNNLNESLVLAESFTRWTPTRLWSASPVIEDDHIEIDPEVAQPGSGNQWIRFWRAQTALMPSPPFEAMDTDMVEEPGTMEDGVGFPPLETQPPSAVTLDRPPRQQTHRTDSDLSLNPLYGLSERSRMYEEDVQRSHSQSDPLAQSSHLPALVTELPQDTHAPGETLNQRRDGTGLLPEDDGMMHIRQRIRAIWQAEGSNTAKSKRVHQLMMESYVASQNNLISPTGLRSVRGPDFKPLTPPPSSPGAGSMQLPTSPGSAHTNTDTFQFLPSDLERSYVPPKPHDGTKDGLTEDTEEGPPQLGCKHYARNVKPQCVTCLRFFPCRLCHDETVTDHALPRHSTKNMLCMHCQTPQPASQWCKNCGECAALYYCSVCKLWNNDPEKSVYHCDDCGICRLGQGIGRDFYHCPTCAVCISITVAKTHRCIERSTKSDCPICGEYMFTSPDTVVFMRCGHSIHETCFKDWCKTAYKCPICSKSVVNMETQFRRLDRHIASQPMPEEYRDAKALVNCNDCSMKSVVPFHWLGLKCAECEGYNTSQIEFIGGQNLPGQQVGEGLADAPGRQEEIAAEAFAHAMAQRAATVAGSQRPSTAISDVAAVNASPWLIPQHRGPRSASPAVSAVSNYFGLERRDERRPSMQTPSIAPDEEIEFWGGQSPRSHDGIVFEQRIGDDGSEESTSDESVDENDDEEMEDDDEEEDVMDLFGHR